MGTELDMYKIKHKNRNIQLEYITTIYNKYVVWKLEELGCSKCSGCSKIVFEIDGYTLNHNKNLLLEGDPTLDYKFKDEDWYECRIYF